MHKFLRSVVSFRKPLGMGLPTSNLGNSTRTVARYKEKALSHLRLRISFVL